MPRPAPDAGHDERVARFLENACPDHHMRGLPAHGVAWHTARRLLEQYPEVATDGFHAALVSGELAEVERALARNPEAARECGGPKQWEPLLYLSFSRTPRPEASEHAVAIARALLDRGADPNAFFMAGDSRYTPLVGVIGMGEEDRPSHPCADSLARLLLERGAEPYDIQVVYNIAMSRTDIRWVLEILYEHCVRTGRATDWQDPEWRMIDMSPYGAGARFLLDHALLENDVALGEWLLLHGASANAAPAPHPGRPRGSLHEAALRQGAQEFAALLVRFGAEPCTLVPNSLEAFTAACLRADGAAARAMAAEHPEYLRSPVPLFAAANRDRADAVTLLLDLGTSPDVADAHGQRALHVAAGAGALNAAAALLERGAEPDPYESRFGATPLGYAVHFMNRAMMDLLSTASRDVWNLTFAGNVARVREVLAAEPERARARLPDGETPLMRLPDDEGAALELAGMLLGRGADPALRDRHGVTAEAMAARRGLREVAAVLRSASG